MDDLVRFFSLTLVEILDSALNAPLWKLLAWTIALTLSAVMITTLASSGGGERLKAAAYIGVGLIIFVEIFRPVDWSMFFG
jgi:hypothetical protein